MKTYIKRILYLPRWTELCPDKSFSVTELFLQLYCLGVPDARKKMKENYLLEKNKKKEQENFR